MIFRLFQHLLPTSTSWNITIDKYLRRFFTGLSFFPDAIKTFVDLIWFDIFPQTTRELDLWETQFGLLNFGLTDQQRRDRLDAAWKETGGQSPSYIQGQLQARGFNVFVHEWWAPGDEPAVGVKTCVDARDPVALLVAPSYPLVNKIPVVVKGFNVLLDDTLSEFGEPDALVGNFDGISITDKIYEVPTDTIKHHYFVYIAAASFPTLANVDAARRDEFETLLLKICPAQLWIGVMVNYT